MTTRPQTKYSYPRAPIVFIVNVNYTYGLHTTLYLQQKMRSARYFSQNYDVGIADGDDDG